MGHRGDDPQRRPVILLVEDQDALRADVARVLEGDGYQVLSAAEGRAALMLIATVGLPIDLVITDIAMPDVGGQAVVAELARHQRTPPVLFISGFSQEDVPGLSWPLLTKPFPPRDLLDRVRHLLRRMPDDTSPHGELPA
jgi:DNA-binding response OmpR family regulator